jgi:hypothetical protein
MRLTSDEVDYLARKIVKTLVGQHRLEVDSESRVAQEISRVITEELMEEDRLNEEVRGVLMEHSGILERENITYTEMFKMVKRRLAKEKGIIL